MSWAQEGMVVFFAMGLSLGLIVGLIFGLNFGERRAEPALRAADALAHEFLYTPAHGRYWTARGENKCTVCQ